jgi:hypothetical protein
LKTVKIRYNFTLYSAAEMKKPKGQRTGKASSTELSSDMPWIDFYEELKMYAAKLYSKPILDNLHNFQINYTIPRVSTDLLALEGENDYEHLLENVVSSKKKDILIKVQISELQVRGNVFRAHLAMFLTFNNKDCVGEGEYKSKRVRN